jgi:hypothetical protein
MNDVTYEKADEIVRGYWDMYCKIESGEVPLQSDSDSDSSNDEPTESAKTRRNRKKRENKKKNKKAAAEEKQVED